MMWLLVIAFAIFVYYLINPHKAHGVISSNSAINVLKERLAKGEIDEETYLRLKNLIGR